MLILTRRSGETICIGSDIQVTVLGVVRGAVRLGIVAPPNVGVHRQEVAERIAREGSDPAKRDIPKLEMREVPSLEVGSIDDAIGRSFTR